MPARPDGGARRKQRGPQFQLSDKQSEEVLKLKEEIEHRVQQQVRRRCRRHLFAAALFDAGPQVLALRHVIADVESAASHAVVPCVKLHNKQR